MGIANTNQGTDQRLMIDAGTEAWIIFGVLARTVTANGGRLHLCGRIGPDYASGRRPLGSVVLFATQEGADLPSDIARWSHNRRVEWLTERGVPFVTLEDVYRPDPRTRDAMAKRFERLLDCLHVERRPLRYVPGDGRYAWAYEEVTSHIQGRDSAALLAGVGGLAWGGLSAPLGSGLVS